MYFVVFLKNVISAAVILDLPCSFNVPCSRKGIANVLYVYMVWFVSGLWKVLELD
jgi:hypothetical protein